MAVASDTKTVVGVFDSVRMAQDAVEALQREGISRNDISIVAHQNAEGYDALEARDKTSDVVADAGIGAAIGGVGGLLLSAAGAITLPVIGPVLAAGPIAAALTGAGVGAAAGGLIGALTESGIPEDDAKHYAEGVRRGDVLVTIKTNASNSERVCDVLDDQGAVDVENRVKNWRDRGWTGYSPEAKPYSSNELSEERSYYGRREPGRTGDVTSLESASTGGRDALEPQRRARVGDRRDLDDDGDVNALERGVDKVREGMEKVSDRTRRARYSRSYDRYL